jgi:hypothetical protein
MDSGIAGVATRLKELASRRRLLAGLASLGLGVAGAAGLGQVASAKSCKQRCKDHCKDRHKNRGSNRQCRKRCQNKCG